MSKKLEGKIAVVTGGSAGIGLGAAKRFAEEGARVFITGRDKAKLDEALAVIGHGASAIRADAGNLGDIDRIYATVKEDAGRIDILFVNAGFYEIGTFGEITAEHFDKTFNTNVRGLLFAVQKALPLLSRGAGSSISRAATSASTCSARAISIRRVFRGFTTTSSGRARRAPCRWDASAQLRTWPRWRHSWRRTTAATSTGSSCSRTAGSRRSNLTGAGDHMRDVYLRDREHF